MRDLPGAHVDDAEAGTARRRLRVCREARAVIVGGALVFVAIVGPGLLAPDAAPTPGAAGKTWVALRLLQVYLLLAAGSVIVLGSDRVRLWHGLLPAMLLVAFGVFLRYGIYDDAYISLRYARNLARGLGPVYNPGERVEGFTSPLWVFLLGGLHRATGLDLIRLAVVGGVAAGCATLAVTAALVPRTLFRGGRTVVALVLAVQFPFVVWSFSGMETALHVALVVFGVVLIFRHWRRSAGERGTRFNVDRNLALAGILFGVAVWARPETPVMALVALCAIVARAGPGRRIREALNFGMAVALPVALLVGFRVAYFGEVLPNTWFAKVDGSSWSLMRHGLSYLGGGAVGLSPLIALAVLGAVRPVPGLSRAEQGLLSALVLAQAAVILYTGADHFAEHRFFVPMLPFLLVLALGGAVAASRLGVGMRHAAPAGVLLLAAGSLSLGLTFFRGEVGATTSLHHGPVLARRWAVIGEWLGHRAAPGDVLATPVAGALPYVSDLTTIDMHGLNDRTIARKKAVLGGTYKDHEKFDLDYVLSRRPKWIFIGHFRVSSVEELHRRNLLPVLRVLLARLPEIDYEVLSGQFEGQGFTFLRRQGDSDLSPRSP